MELKLLGGDCIEILIYIIPFACGAIASYTDIKERKIRNIITYPMIITGIVLNSYSNGLQGFLHSIYGVALVFILIFLLPSFSLGGGDIKLLMGYGSYLGYQSVLTLIFFTLVILLIVNISTLIKKESLNNLWNIIKLEVFSFGRIREKSGKTPGALVILFAYCMFLIFI